MSKRSKNREGFLKTLNELIEYVKSQGGNCEKYFAEGKSLLEQGDDYGANLIFLHYAKSLWFENGLAAFVPQVTDEKFRAARPKFEEIMERLLALATKVELNSEQIKYRKKVMERE